MRQYRAALAGLALVLCGAAAVAAAGIARGVFLFDAGSGSRWIVGITPRSLGIYPRKPIIGVFRLAFSLDQAQPAGVLELRAVERAEVWLDGEAIYRDPEPAPGRATRAVPHRAIGAGEHALEIGVIASTGPTALWLRSDSLPVSTSSGAWTFVWDGVQGAPRRAPFATDVQQPFPISREFPHVGRAFASVLPALVPLFALAFAWALRGWRAPTPEQLRFALLAFWCALALNNIAALRPGLGMDVAMHLHYVRVLVEQHRIPLATEGGEMMQPPLAYLLYAPLYSLFSASLPALAVEKALRILPFACGAAQVELAYRAARSVFPNRADLQRVAMLVGGLLPINLYLAHAVANEPVVGLFGGATALAALRIVSREEPPAPRELATAGLLLGLALLSKVTAALLAPALFAAVAWRSLGAQRVASRAAVQVAAVAAVAALIAGWYYARNWILLGTPFLGTWRPEIGNAWWQEPGYRTAAQYLRFGEALAHPIYSASIGLWDGLYSTFWLDGWMSATSNRKWAAPWNVAPLLAGAWLALAPTLVLAAGALCALRSAGERPSQRLALRLAAGTVALYLAAILYLHLMVPFFCIAKGSYFAAATPLFAVLAAAGYGELARSRYASAALGAALVCWAANAIASYWVL